jgi:hypothetical protein
VVGTVDIPSGIERDRYFRELPYLELSALFPGPLKPSALARWSEVAPRGSIGLVAPFSLTHRRPPSGAKLWPHDASTGEFRDSPLGRAALEQMREAVTALGARCVVFRSPESYSPSAANREQLHRFFGEIATTEAVGGVERVWVPGGLWDARTAAKLATELGVTCAIDPLARAPGDPPEIHHDLDVTALYLRVESAGPLRSERLDDLVELAQHYEDRSLVFALASADRWQDARKLRKLLDEL